MIRPEIRNLRLKDVLDRCIDDPKKVLYHDVLHVGRCVCGKPSSFAVVTVVPVDLIDVDVVVGFLCEDCCNGEKKG
ncbi:MAG: hypothetical protein H7836_13175 [Magnetococcus sp. YQC-3]